MMRSIQSAQNDNFKRWVTLLHSRGIHKYQQMLASGQKTVREILRRHPRLVNELIFDESFPDDLIANFNRIMPARLRSSVSEATAAIRAYSIPHALFAQLDVFGTRQPLAILQTPELDKANLEQEPNGLEVLVALGDPANLGALLRSAEGFAVGRVILLRESSSPFHPKCLRASSGSNLRVTLATGPSIQDLTLVPNLYVLDKSGIPIDQFDWPRDVRLLLGAEGQGVPSNLDHLPRLSIPMAASLESLNAVTAASIAFYEKVRRTFSGVHRVK